MFQRNLHLEPDRIPARAVDRKHPKVSDAAAVTDPEISETAEMRRFATAPSPAPELLRSADFSSDSIEKSRVGSSVVRITQNVIGFARLKHPQLHDCRRLSLVRLQIDENVGKEQSIEENSLNPGALRSRITFG